MDLNELLHSHQVAVMKASAAGRTAERDGHFAKVALYASRIRDLRKTAPVSAIQSTGAADTVIYGTYAGDNALPRNDAGVGAWESEGGALNPSQPSLPEGISCRLEPQYFVGPYRYSDLDLAIAENLRQKKAAAGTQGPAG
ncbi:MAG: hypothetical protein R3E18_10820 [Sphingomonadaceae bacterium]|nr:hypothetical protein [Sphingomonadaceae bacterium]